MTVPLSHFLTRFSALPVAVTAAVTEAPLAIPETLLMLTAAELEARIDVERQAAVAAVAASHATEAASLAMAHESAMSEALTSARAEWSAEEGGRLAALIEAATVELHALICERTVAVLRPWLAEAVTTRARRDLDEAFGRLLAETKSPCVRVSGPADLVDAMRESRPDASVEWAVAETVDVTMIADATRIETQLANALADLTLADLTTEG